ncbi:MAG: hypothetical protein ACYDCG_05055 [Candidatus Acidiferrales bacterium]
MSTNWRRGLSEFKTAFSTVGTLTDREGIFAFVKDYLHDARPGYGISATSETWYNDPDGQVNADAARNGESAR